MTLLGLGFLGLALALASLVHAAERAMFSPRMDYEEWTPLGRGDPLKNDPTYDYVPPVLDRVNYWMQPESRTPDPPTTTSHPSQAKKNDNSDLRRDDLDSLMNMISERRSAVSGRLATQYIPLQGSYQVYVRPQVPAPAPAPAPAPMLMLMPPPPPPSPPPQPPTTTEAATTMYVQEMTEATTLATPQPHTSTQHIHKVLTPVIDIHPDGGQSLSSSLLQIILQNEVPEPEHQPTTTSTTTHPALTTDPLFSHYKQPAEPLHGPMYLIIQGHSKVKTYGASKLDRLSGIPIQDDNEVEERQRTGRGLDTEDLLPVDEAVEAVVKDYVDLSYDESGTGESTFKKLFFALNQS